MEKKPPSDSHLRFMIRGYCLEELLGYGKTTSLYRARTEELWQMSEVIMMLLHIPETFSIQARERFLERFLHEASRVVQLRHSSLFPLYGFGEEDGLPYLVIPDVTGVSLASRIKQKKHWSPSEILPILEPIASALSYVHSKGLVYQFFNPTNVLFQKDAPPQITGLNLSQILRLAGLEEPTINLYAFDHLKNIGGGYLGSPEYLAPEVVRGAKPDPRSDVYSLGIIMFEMLSGQPPFTGQDYLEVAQKHTQALLPSLHALSPEMPVVLELIVNRALHRDLNYRFQTPNELVAAFAHVLEERIYRVMQVPLLLAGEQIRALLAAPSSKTSRNREETVSLAQPVPTPAHAPEHQPQEKRKLHSSDEQAFSPIVALPSSSAKRSMLVDDSIGLHSHTRSLHSSRGFLPSEPKRDLTPSLNTGDRKLQRDDQPSDAAALSASLATKQSDIATMAQEIQMMMRNLQSSLSK